MRRYRLLFIGGIGFFFIVACLCWIFYFPFRPGQVLRVIPPEAILATWHQQPAERLESLFKSAPAALILAAMDVTAAEAAAALDTPGLQTLVKKLGGTGITLAYAPRFGGRREPAIMMGAWVGGLTTHLMRAGRMDQAFEGYTMHQIGQDRLWIGPSLPEAPLGMRYVSFGVYEGVLAGCISSDPFAAIPLLTALRRHGELTELVAPWVDRRGRLKTSAPTGADLFRARWFPGKDGLPIVCAGNVHLQEDGALSGMLLLEESGSPSDRPTFFGPIEGNSGSFSPLKSLLPLPSDVPALMLATTVERGIAAAADLPPGVREQLLLSPLAALSAPGATCQLWVSTGIHSGRIMRMKVPSAGFAMQVPPGTDVATVAAQVADAINSIYRMGLISVPDRHDRRICAFQTVKDVGFFKFLQADELPAMAVTDGWLLIMTNVGALRRVLERMTGQPLPPMEGNNPPWLWLYGATHLPSTGEALSNALAGYALVRLIQTGKAQHLDSPMVQRLLKAMGQLGTASVRIGHNSDGRLMLTWTLDRAGGDHHE